MKKSVIMLSFIALGAVTLSACGKNKCHECHYEKDGQEIELGEKCGDDLEAIEASGFNDNGTVYEVHCHEH
jgi:hypothetical protein